MPVELDEEATGNPLDVERAVDRVLVCGIVAAWGPTDAMHDLDIVSGRPRRVDPKLGDRHRPTAATNETRADQHPFVPLARITNPDKRERAVVKLVDESTTKRPQGAW